MIILWIELFHIQKKKRKALKKPIKIYMQLRHENLKNTRKISELILCMSRYSLEVKVFTTGQ